LNQNHLKLILLIIEAFRNNLLMDPSWQAEGSYSTEEWFGVNGTSVAIADIAGVAFDADIVRVAFDADIVWGGD
jgi:hypothetical protein